MNSYLLKPRILSAAILAVLGTFCLSAQAATTCALPGIDGTVTVNDNVNTFWRPLTAVANAGITSISLGTRRGVAQDLAPGDLVLIIQMQCVNLDIADSDNYGDGAAGEPAAGYTDRSTTECRAGTYEFARAGAATNASSLDLTGSALQNTYLQQEATASVSRATYQIIRVPQYSDATISGTINALAWDGFTGGVIAIDAANTITLSGATLNADGAGFRGGGGRARSTNDAQQRFRWDDDTRHAVKGEGIAGTPRFVSNKRNPDNGTRDSITDLGIGWLGYPTGTANTGDWSRGAPGNAGGGGAFWDGASDNGGGGGGGNGNSGGRGGAGWRNAGYGANTGTDGQPINATYSNHPEKKWGFGGAQFTQASTNRVVLGGGGGGGDNNDNSGTDGFELSSGAAGGGIVMLRANTITETSSTTISVRGARAADNINNDGAGGGGSGGSVVMMSNTWSASPSINAFGGRGGDAFQPGAVAHGSGGGGGGGVVVRAGAASVDVSGGNPGITTTADSPPAGATHGAEAGGAGQDISTTASSDTAGGNAGYKCNANLAVTKDNAQTTYTPGTNATYTITINNSGPGPALNYAIADTLPNGVTLTGSWSCNALPSGILGSSCSANSGGAAGGNSVALSANIASGGSVTISVPVQYSSDPANY